MNIIRLIFTLLLFLVVIGLAGAAAYLAYNWYTQHQIAGAPMILSNTTTTLRYIDTNGTIKIASWNMQRFGLTKANNEALMTYYTTKLKDYDVIILQEVTDETGYAVKKMCYMMSGYTCKASDRRGNTTYQEQYLLMYKTGTIQLISYKDNPTEPGYQRPPYTALLKAGNWTFELTTIHTTPTAVHSELYNLQLEVLDDWVGDKIVIGDLNGDCAYYPKIIDFTSWSWVNDQDTTVAATTTCAYDRIIINDATMNNYVTYGVMSDVKPTQSDHYLLYGVFKDTEA